ncbi:MAG: ABC transporter ATP-binding protein [Nitrospirae bacterium]|nr:ABC transporter ATP-binding protein [Nitrospirota bacterium]
MIVIDNISFSYNKKEVLKNIDLRINNGELTAVLGVNGSGKSTLLKTINHLLKPSKGAVYISGDDLKGMTKKEIARKIGYMPQKSNGVLCTVFDAVLLGRTPHIGWNVSKRDTEVVHDILRLMNMEDYSMRQTYQLSGGELQKVLIARALAQEPKVLLLDEPINHLDIKNQVEIMSMLHQITAKLGIVTMVVLHDLNTAMRFSDKFIMLKDGVVFSHGGREIITPASIKEVFTIDVLLSDINGIPVVIPAAPGIPGHK